jgi:hypothetical protein
VDHRRTSGTLAALLMDSSAAATDLQEPHRACLQTPVYGHEWYYDIHTDVSGTKLDSSPYKSHLHGDVVVLLVVAPRGEEVGGAREPQRSSSDRARALLRTEGLEAEAPSYRTADISRHLVRKTRTPVKCVAREECPSMSRGTYETRMGAARGHDGGPHVGRGTKL